MELEDIFLQKVCKMLVSKGEMPVESSKFSPGTPVLNHDDLIMSLVSILLMFVQ